MILFPVGIVIVPTLPNEAKLSVLTIPGIMHKSPSSSNRIPYIDA
jgi:hypothetical protein